ncbi:MAG TPA: glycosyltransferase family 87 protein [Vicinamibacterales bacterium]|nr:glycosyltransferase family 87 protein [Vicinamibacterales bacterium]
MQRRYLLGGYLLLAVIASLQQWWLVRPGDPYTHYNNYVIFRQSFYHLIGQQDLYVERLGEHWDFFRYSPSFALAFGAVAWMPDVIGLLLWNALNAVTLYLAWVTLPVRSERMKLAAGWFVAIELMTALQNAQSNALIAGLLILAFNSLERKRIAQATLLIVAAAFIKVFGLVALALGIFYPGKKKFVLSAALWATALALLPLIVVSPEQLVRLYGSWGRLLATDYAGSTGLSLMAWLQTWFGIDAPKRVVALVGLAILVLPLSFVRRYDDLPFRLLFLCDILIWVVIFNHKAESSSYIIAVSGVALWFFARETSRLDTLLLVLTFVFTTLSPTDVFPRSVSAAFFVPYVIKVVPCVLIWAKITFDLVSRYTADARPQFAS